jgi:hypothetical protein
VRYCFLFFDVTGNCDCCNIRICVLHSLLLDKAMEYKLCFNWLTVTTVQKANDWNVVVDVGREVTLASYVSTWLIEPKCLSTVIDMHVESVLRETVLNSSNWRYFLHFHICLMCVYDNVCSYSGTLSQQMVTSKPVKSNNPYALNVCVTFKCWKIAFYVGGCYCATITAAVFMWWQMLLHSTFPFPYNKH